MFDKDFNTVVKMPETEEFKLAFRNFWKQNPNLKNEPIMYMCISKGLDFFKHSLTRQGYRVKEVSK